ncbi:MAG: hypothetical protein H0Z39_06845 [Peptococcaceae bacterium]|nr:hypothetical protein [Peptococcaceae bacterium]
MDKPNLDLSSLPEPLRSMLQNVDVDALKEFASKTDPQSLLEMLSSTVDQAKQQLGDQQSASSLDQLLNAVRELVEAKTRQVKE